MHKYLNKLLKTDNAYYKNASIYPVLDTIEDKLCNIMLDKDDEEVQCTPQQAKSPDDIETADEFIHKLKKVDYFGDFSEDAMKAMTGMFNQPQLCHENAAKMVGHMAQLTKTLQPKQFTYVMKHSLCPLVQLSIPPHLCSPADLKFNKIRLTPAERKEEHTVNIMLPRPCHPTLTTLPCKTCHLCPSCNHTHGTLQAHLQFKRVSNYNL